MKTIILSLFAVIATLNAHAATTHSVNCSNYSGSIQRNDSEITIRTVTLAGPTTLKYQLADLNVKSLARTILDTRTQTIETICKIPRKIVDSDFAEKISFSRKDGMPLIQDDTPASSPKEMTVTQICQSRDADEWPCQY